MTGNSNKLRLSNARVVMPERVAESAPVIVDDGIITSISDEAAGAADETARDTDLSGLTLFPGFIDVHIHGAVGVDTMEADVDDLQRVSTFLAQNGVTAWLPTLVPARQNEYGQAVRSIGECVSHLAGDEAASEYRLQSGTSSAQNSPTEVGTLTPVAQILGVHYEGPFVNSEQCGALHREHFRKFRDPEDLNSLPVIEHGDAIHMMTLAPEVEGGIELIKELTKRKWICSIGHTKASADILEEAFAAGARHMTHFMNAMTPLHHRSLGAVGWGMIHDDVTCDLIADGIHINREILKLIVHNKTSNKVSLISDAIAAAGCGDGDYQIWGETIQVRNGRTQNAGGSIAGSVITMLDAMRMMLSLGFSEPDVATMASLNPARLLGIDADCGSIQIGKRADLVALDRDGKIRMTLIGGQVAYDAR